jgi:zinc/manganese transport system substrate-binding protein
VLNPVALVVTTALALGLAGCAAPAPDPSADDVVRIVASTNVYGDLAATVGGAHVEVTSVIDDPAQDPHQFEANPRVQLALSRADIVIVNGGGYDDFMTTMLDASANQHAVVIDAFDVASGLTAVVESGNEHVWYDYEAMIGVVNRIAIELSDLDPANDRDYTKSVFELTGRIQGLGTTADEVAGQVAGAGAIITEPVPLFLLDRMGFENLTPPEFSEAIEEDSDIPPALLQTVLNLIGDGSAAIVVYNEQTGGPQTDAVLDVATDNQVPAIGVTETLPDDMGYVQWQNSIQEAILAALDG